MPPVLAGAVFWIAVAACAVAQVAILRSVLAARSPERAGSRPVETFWAVLPAVGLAVLLALTWRALHPAADAAARADRALPVAPAAHGAAEV